MKRLILAVFLVSGLAFALVSCGDDKPPTKEAGPSSSSGDTAKSGRDLLKEEPAKPTPDKPADQTPPPTPTGGGTTGQEAAAAAHKQTFEEAMAFATQNPTSYKNVIEKLEKAKASLEGTEWKEKIVDKLNAVKKEFEEKGNEAFLAIEKTVQGFIASRDFQAASKAASEFPKTLADTQGAKKAAALKERLATEQRTAAEDDLKTANAAASKNQFGKALELYKKLKTYAPDDMHQKLDECITNLEYKMQQEGDAALGRFVQSYDAVFAEVTKLVEAGQADAAVDKCDMLMRTPDYGLASGAKPDDETVIHFANLAADVKQAAALVKKVLEHYSALVGQAVEVSLRSGKEKGTIEKIEEGTMVLRIGGKPRSVTFGDMRQEDVIGAVLTDSSAETLNMIISFWMASGKPQSAQKIVRKGAEGGQNMDAWKEKLAAMENYLKLAAERKKEADLLRSKAEAMEKLGKLLEKAVAEFKTGSFDEALSALGNILKAGKNQAPEVLKDLSTKCASLSGHTLVSLVKTCRTSCSACTNSGTVTCSKCRGSTFLMVDIGNNKQRQVPCSQCKATGKTTCRSCAGRRVKADYENIEKGFIEAEMR